MGVPKKGWCMRENTTKMDDLGVTFKYLGHPHFRKKKTNVWGLGQDEVEASQVLGMTQENDEHGNKWWKCHGKTGM